MTKLETFQRKGSPQLYRVSSAWQNSRGQGTLCQ